jgi:hypothetical protein
MRSALVWRSLLLAGVMGLPASPAFAQAEEEGDDSAEAAEPAPSSQSKPTADGATETTLFQDLKSVESDVNDLKEKVFRSKARLLLLEEKVIRGVVSGAKLSVRHVNELGTAYALDSITYYVDGTPVYQATDTATGGTLSKEKTIDVYEANIAPGNHTISASGVIKGRGTGMFSYLSDYSFQFSTNYPLVAADGKTTRLDATLFKRGGAAADYLEGPAVEFRAEGEGSAKGGKAGKKSK